MAMAKLLALLVIALLAISMADYKVLAKESEHNENMSRENKGSQGSLKNYQCPSKCQDRCSNTEHKKPCLFFCNKCCNTCLCVPSGYYGNKGECPCYNNWKTKRGGPKCP